MPGTASSVVTGAVLGAVVSLLVPYFGGISKLDTREPDSVGTTSACRAPAGVWRFHVADCDDALRGAPLLQGQSDSGLQLVFNTSSSRCRIVNPAQQGGVEKDGATADKMIEALDVHEGATLHVGGACYLLTAPVDDTTRVSVECYRQSTFAMIKPDAFPKLGEVISRIEEVRSLRITGLRLLRLEPALVRLFYAEHSERSFFQDLVSYVTSGPVVVLRLVGPDAVRVWREALGPTDSAAARRDAPGSVRALFGADKQRNAAHGSDSVAAARMELSFFFKETSFGLVSSSEPLTPTSCLVLPHVLRERSLGALVTSLKLQHDSTPAAASVVQLNRMDALRYVTGVLLPRAPPSQQQLEQMEELTSGPALSLDLQSADTHEIPIDFVRRFKDIIGPHSPARARKTAVESIRANYGVSDVQSGLICPWYDWPSQ